MFNNIAEENFPNLEKGMDIQVQELYRSKETRQEHKFPSYITVSTLNKQNKERVLKAARKIRSHMKTHYAIGIMTYLSATVPGLLEHQNCQ